MAALSMGSPWVLVALAGLNGFIAVAASAFGAHGLEDKLSPAALALFEQAAFFQLTHAIALAVLGAISLWRGERPIRGIGFAAMGFLIGILCFCGSLYWLAINGSGSLGPFHWVTPIGGTCLIIGWGVLTVSSMRFALSNRA